MRKWFTDAKAAMPGRAWIVHCILWLCAFGLMLEMFWSTTEHQSLILLPISMMSFGLHEMAHVATSFLPPTLTAAAGSLSELLFGGLIVFVAYRKRAYITTVFGTLWYLYASLSAGRYMADARSQLLPLVSINSAINDDGEALHDWHMVFSRLGILGADKLIGNSVKAVGIMLAISGLGVYAYWIFEMTKKRPIPTELLQTTEIPNVSVTRVVYSQDPIDLLQTESDDEH